MTVFKSIILFLFIASQAVAQSDSISLNRASDKTLKKLGKNALLQDDPNSAITFLEAYQKRPKGKKDVEGLELLGRAYLITRDYLKAKKNFLRAYELDKENAVEALYYHAQMHKSLNAYDSAKVAFQKFRKEYKGDDKVLKKQATKEILFCDSVQSLVGKKPTMLIKHLDTTINKVHVEAAPITITDNELVFSSYRTEQREYTQEDDTASIKRRKLYHASRDKNGNWKFSGEFGEQFNSENFHAGSVTFSPDRKRMYFTRCRNNAAGKMMCSIYMSENLDDIWTEPQKLPSPVNHKKYTSTMPTVGLDPVKGSDVLYFVSDRPGGKGGLDIWYTLYDKKNKVFKPLKNAGVKVNTSQDEISPYYDSETRSLFFSSNGWGGMGGLDVLKTTGDGKKWTGNLNLGMPVNSGADDLFYSIGTNREEGFFVSNRKGGNGLKNATCCDDIYYYKHLQYVNVKLEGDIHDMLNPDQMVDNAQIEIFFIDKTTNEKVLVKTIRTDDKGHYATTIEPGHDYFVVVKKDDYLGTSVDLTTQGVLNNVSIDKDLQMVKKPKAPIHIPNVKYQYDRADIDENSKLVLDTTVYKLMVDNPEIIVEIMAHTDDKGTDAYNLKLSQRRAESIVKYLISKGISPVRLKAKGYGESMPVAPNANADGTDNPEGRSRNRRTDFKIVGVVDAELINDSEVPY